MIKLVDGRPNPYQWDTNAEVEFDGLCDQFHFANRVYGRSINVKAEQKDGKSKCLIPIQLLQSPNNLDVFVFIGSAESGYTKVEHTFKVEPRNKPSDYVFTPAEQMTIDEIEKIANEAMQKSTNAENIAQSVRDDANAGKFNGKDGKDGLNGKDGAKGDKGDKGADGKDGASDYPLLTNKPSINGVTLDGNKTSEQLKIKATSYIASDTPPEDTSVLWIDTSVSNTFYESEGVGF